MTKTTPVITIMGPTASGKTDLAMRLVDELNGQIISVDSALIYKGMDIGTAKPTPEELTRYPHKLISFLDPAETYSAADFCRDAQTQIELAYANGKVPILVGGTMMYFKSLLDGMSSLPESDPTVREEINQQAERLGWPAMHQALSQIDVVAGERIHPNDSQRITRALEVFAISGKTMTELTSDTKQGLAFDVAQFGFICEDKSLLHQRIEQRFHKMLELGFEQEVQHLFAREDLHPDLPSIRSVGYRQMWQYLSGELSWDEMVFRGVVATRQLAKRQLTWLRSWSNMQSLTIGNDKENLQLVLNSLK